MLNGQEIRQETVKLTVEPTIDDILGDPVVHILMDRDGVSLEELRDIVGAARARLLARREQPCAA